MAPNKLSGKNIGAKNKRMIPIEIKREIIEKHEQGVRVIDLARQYERTTSTICTILKQKESINAIIPAKGIKIISKLRTSVHEKMENLLLMWLREKELAGDTVPAGIVCEKARAIYADLVQQTPGTSVNGTSGGSFKASRGWFDNFTKRTCVHSIVRHGVGAHSDVKVVEDYLKRVAEIIKAVGSIPQQVFNPDKTGLFWGKMPMRTYITADELQEQQRTEVSQGIGSDKEAEAKEVPSTREIEEMFGMWEKLTEFIKKKHPEKASAGRALALFNDTCLTHFQNILKERNEKTSDGLLLKRSACESEEMAAKKQETVKETKLGEGEK